MKQLNKTVILGAIAILIIIIIIVMTFFYVNDIRQEQLKEIEEQKKEELSLIDQIENLTYYLELYQGENLIYGEGQIINWTTDSNTYFLLDYESLEYHPNNLPDQFKKDNQTIKFIAFINGAKDPITDKQLITFLRINDTDLELTK